MRMFITSKNKHENIWNMFHSFKLPIFKANNLKLVRCNTVFLLVPEKFRIFANFTTFTITMITNSHTFQYEIVLTIFKISGHLSKKKSDNGLWPEGNKNTVI